MDEPRDQQPDAGSSRSLIAAAVTLSPLQEAWARYVNHATTCDHCRDVDRGRCEAAEELWSAYQAQGEAAYRRLGDRA